VYTEDMLPSSPPSFTNSVVPLLNAPRVDERRFVSNAVLDPTAFQGSRTHTAVPAVLEVLRSQC